jgi:hypothetical protein
VLAIRESGGRVDRFVRLLYGPFIALLAVTAHSAEPDSRYFYAGAGIADVEPTLYEDFGGCYNCGYSTGGSTGVGFTLTGGWRFHRFMALEASYVYGDEPGYKGFLMYVPELSGFYDVNARMDYQSIDLGLLGIFEGKVWDIYAKGGVAYYDAQSRQDLVEYPTGAMGQRTVDRQDWSWVFALGGGFRFADDRYRVRLEYRIIQISPKLLAAPSGDASMGIADLQIQVRFGR